MLNMLYRFRKNVKTVVTLQEMLHMPSSSPLKLYKKDFILKLRTGSANGLSDKIGYKCLTEERDVLVGIELTALPGIQNTAAQGKLLRTTITEYNTPKAAQPE